MYLFHDNRGESHYSNAIILVTIPKKSKDFQRMVLSQQYLSEGYEYDITSRFVSPNEVEVTKLEKFNASNLSHEDDSLSRTVTRYIVTDKGKIVLIIK